MFPTLRIGETGPGPSFGRASTCQELPLHSDDECAEDRTDCALTALQHRGVVGQGQNDVIVDSAELGLQVL